MIERKVFKLPDMETPFRKVVVQYSAHEETFHLCATMTELKLLVTDKLVAIKLLDLNVDGVPVSDLDLLEMEVGHR